ncbi:MAG: hypothetical protein K0Q49_211 [Haloplasmataceae bacterium]|jgi:ABC-type glycerol-3-phosphate transport system substrate-binding protein|nr:hypothetical protein [Haloplasmataceae bacterium]
MKKFNLVLTIFIMSIALVGCVKTRNQAPVIQGAVTNPEIVVGEDYNPLDGVVATDDKDGTLTVSVVGTYNVNSVGTYNFKLEATDSEGLKAEVPVVLTVTDPTSTNKAPQLLGVVENQTFFIGSETTYDPKANVSATDAEDGNITANIVVEGPYSLITEGAYILTIKVTDSDNATATKTVILTVKQSTIPQLSTVDPIEVTFWHAFGDDKETLLQGYADEFKLLYPNITITLASQGGYEDLRSKVTSAIVAGTEPTMLIGYPDHVASYLSANAVEPLDQYVTHSQYGIEIADFVESYIKENKSFDDDGTLYGLPFNKSTEILIYNKTYFTANNLLVPETWDDVKTVSQEIKAKETDSKVYGFSYDSAANMFITMTKQWGGQYTGLDEFGEGELLFDNVKTREMLTYFKQLADQNLSTLPQTWEQDYASEPFKIKQVYMTVGSTAGVTYNIPTDNSFEIGVAPIPQKDVNNKSVIQQGTNISIMKSSDAQEKLAAWLFTKYLTSVEVTTNWAINTGYLPVRESAFSSTEYQAFLNYTGTNPKSKAISLAANAAYQQKDYMFVDQPFIGSSKVRVEVEQLINSVLVGNVNIDEAIQKAIDEIE